MASVVHGFEQRQHRLCPVLWEESPTPFHGGGKREIVSRPRCYAFDTGFVTFEKGWDTIHADDRGLSPTGNNYCVSPAVKSPTPCYWLSAPDGYESRRWQ